MQRIKITLLSGKNLMPPRDAAVCDPFCVVKLGTQKYISSTKRGVNPVWNEGFLFSKPTGAAILHVDAMNKDRIKVQSATSIGSVDLDIEQYLDQVPVTVDLRLKYGSIQVKIDDPLKAQSFGNTRTTPMATQAAPIRNAAPQRSAQQAQPTRTGSRVSRGDEEAQQPQAPQMQQEAQGMQQGRMGRGGRGGYGGYGYPPPPPPGYPEDGEGMRPPPMFMMGPPPGGWRRPHVFRPGMTGMPEDMSALEQKYGKWGQKNSDGTSTDETSSVHSHTSQSGRGAGGRGGPRMGGRGGRPGMRPPFFGMFHRPHGFGRFNFHMHNHAMHEQQLQQFDHSFAKQDAEDAPPPTALPTHFEETDEEKAEKLKRWAKFAAFLAKPFEYESAFKAQLQELDAMGCINLGRVRREQIPRLTINMCAALFFNPYEGMETELGQTPVDNALKMAKTLKERGYRIFYCFDGTPMDFYRWVDWLIVMVQSELMVYFNGYSTLALNTDNTSYADKLYFYDAKQKFAKMSGQMGMGFMPPPPTSASSSQQRGYPQRTRGGSITTTTNTTVQPGKSQPGMMHPPMMGGRFGMRKPEEIKGVDFTSCDLAALYKLVANKENVDVRLTLIVDSSYRLPASFKSDSIPASLAYTATPPNTIVLRSLPRSSSSAGDSFVSAFIGLISRRPSGTFKDLQSELTRASSQTFSLHTVDASMISASIFPTLEEGQQEVQIEEITEEVVGQPLEEITEIPDEDIPSAVEQEIAQVRWQSFCDELAKPAPYTSKYKTMLQKLDSMGAINLERITRAQIPPNIYIAQCIVLFFNPYEDLPHTLEEGPVNDALLMAELYLSRNYHVMYICDATPHEYYRWMDYLLDNVKKDLVVFFSGHGTQIKDTTGKEKDGLSEVMVFYDSNRKKSTEKISAVSGITNETVSDACMFDLITSKEYPDTRIVTITDCCHSGTMFNFDQKVPSTNTTAEGITPPLNVICIGSAQDSETAKQTSFKGVEAGVFTYNYTNLLKDKPKTTFKELKTYMTKSIKKYQNINLNASSADLLNGQIITDLEE